MQITKPIDVKCPRCGALARFEEPFEFRSARHSSAEESRPAHHWGSWLVVERFPTHFSWQAPANSSQFIRDGGTQGGEGYPLLSYGLIRCGSCHYHGKHQLKWPHDAYWQWEIRGALLWAWDREHAQSILEHIQQTHRPARTEPYLKYIPSHFLSAKVRDLVVQKMQRSL